MEWKDEEIGGDCDGRMGMMKGMEMISMVETLAQVAVGFWSSFIINQC